MMASTVVADRKVAALRQAMGPVIAQALADKRVVEVMVNPDGKIWIDRIGEGRSFTGHRLQAVDADRILRLLADHVGEVVTRDRPRISATLPETGERFQGVFMPVVASPAFAIRKRPEVVFTLDDYVSDGTMPAAVADALRQAANDRQNLLIAGGTGVTPFVAFMEDAMVKGLEGNVWLHYGARAAELLVFREFAERCAACFPSFRVSCYAETCGSRGGPGTISGRIDLARAVSLARDGRSAAYYLCGPQEMIAVFRTQLTGEFGVAEENVRIDKWE